MRDSNLTHVRTYAVLEVERLELEGSYRMEGRGGGAWAWIGADTIHSKVIFKTCLSLWVRIQKEFISDLMRKNEEIRGKRIDSCRD